MMLAGQRGTPAQGIRRYHHTFSQSDSHGIDCLYYPHCAQDDGYLPVSQQYAHLVHHHTSQRRGSRSIGVGGQQCVVIGCLYGHHCIGRELGAGGSI